MTKQNSINELVKRTHNDIQHQTTHTQNQPHSFGVVKLINAQYHMILIYISWYRESWTIQLNYTFETRQERITASYHPALRNGHTNSWYVYVSQKELI